MSYWVPYIDHLPRAPVGEWTKWPILLDYDELDLYIWNKCFLSCLHMNRKPNCTASYALRGSLLGILRQGSQLPSLHSWFERPPNRSTSKSGNGRSWEKSSRRFTLFPPATRFLSFAMVWSAIYRVTPQSPSESSYVAQRRLRWFAWNLS